MDVPTSSVSECLCGLVRRLLAPEAEAAIPDPIPATTPLIDLGITSLKMVNLMLAIESEFDIMLPASDITPENFRSLASIEALVIRALAQKPS
jgi:acyl carrier protein